MTAAVGPQRQGNRDVGRPSRPFLVLSVICAALTLSGCLVGGSSADVAGPSLEPEPAETATDEPSEDPGTSPTPAPSIDPRMQVKACPGPVAAEAQQVIEAQVAEFAKGRFKRARQYASDEFRKSISLKDFRTIIKQDYPFLLESPRVTFTGCVERDGKAFTQVALAGESVTVLTYRLVRDPDGSLAIDAATISAVSMDPNV